MSSTSGSFEDFLEQFKKRHAKDFGIDSRASVSVKAQMAKVEVKAPVAPVSAPKAVVADDGWDAAEEVQVEQEEYWR